MPEEMVTDRVVLKQMEDRWNRLLGPASDLDLTRRESLSGLAGLIRKAVLNELIKEHPLAPILVAALGVLSEHAEAFDRLEGLGVANVHARQIEEGCMTLAHLCKSSSDYSFLVWRWKSFKTVHSIRNRLVNLKGDLHPNMTRWISENTVYLKKVSSKFTGDVAKDRDSFWLKFGNWLYPTNIRDIFKKNDHLSAYQSEEYEWASHFVHFSPLYDKNAGFSIADLAMTDQFTEFGNISLLGVLRTVHPMMRNPAVTRKLHLRLVYREMFLLLRDNPGRFERVVDPEGSGTAKFLVSEIMREDTDLDRLELILLSAPPKDPYVIEVPTATPAPEADG